LSNQSIDRCERVLSVMHVLCSIQRRLIAPLILSAVSLLYVVLNLGSIINGKMCGVRHLTSSSRIKKLNIDAFSCIF
jgi:hypothetical protein